jgi:hypothetical protein
LAVDLKKKNTSSAIARDIADELSQKWTQSRAIVPPDVVEK